MCQQPACTPENCRCGWSVRVRREGETSIAEVWAFGAKLSETTLNADGDVAVRPA